MSTVTKSEVQEDNMITRPPLLRIVGLTSIFPRMLMSKHGDQEHMKVCVSKGGSQTNCPTTRLSNVLFN